MSSPVLWYATRATGLVALILLTATTMLGILTANRATSPRWPGFSVQDLHRRLSVITMGFLACHILTSVVDTYVHIGWTAIVVPFASSYKRVWVAFGAVGVDLLLAVTLTSMLRHKIRPRTWRAVHWLAYLSWPVALSHAFGMGTDMRQGWVIVLTIACVGAVAGAGMWRVALAARAGTGPWRCTLSPTAPRAPTSSTSRLETEEHPMPTAITDPDAGTRAGTRAVSDETTAARVTLLGSWRARRRADLVSHHAHHGPPPLPQARGRGWSDRFAATIEASGLTGRGGASFPSATKLELVRSAKGTPTLVVNAMEGEPASAKDRVLLSCVPHLVLDGAELAACALGAARIVVCVGGDRPDTADAVMAAVAQRAGTAWAPVPVEVACPPGGYVAGEESALVSWVRGESGVPKWRPDKREPLGLLRGAALVHNAETLAHMGLIARYGPASFRATGTADAPGTTLVTVSGGVEHPGVYEVAMGTPLGAVVGQARPNDEVAAVLTGGFGGSWVPAAALATPYTPRDLAAVGGVVGPGVLVVLTRRSCGVAETRRVARYMAGESAGQCGPCVFGLPAVADDLERLESGYADPDAIGRIGARVASVDGRGACRHPDGVARMVRSALSVFAADAAAHAEGRPCAFRDQPSVLPAPVWASAGSIRAGTR